MTPILHSRCRRPPSAPAAPASLRASFRVLLLISINMVLRAAAASSSRGVSRRLASGSAAAAFVPPATRRRSLRFASTTTSSSSSSSSSRSNFVDALQQQYMNEEMCIGVTFDDKPLKPLSKKAAHLVKNKGPILHRAFSVFLFNEQGQLLLQKRAGCKITFPLYWTNTCCSHPLWTPLEMGEDVLPAGPRDKEGGAVLGCKRAAIRKMEHELGLPTSAFTPEELVFMTRIHYLAESDDVWGEHEIDYLFLVQKPGVDKLLGNVNPNEVGETLFVGAQELRAMLRRAELYRGEALSPQEEEEEAAEAVAAGEAVGSHAQGALRFTPWCRAIIERFLFLWWEDVGPGEGKDLARHFDRGRIHRLGRLDP